MVVNRILCEAKYVFSVFSRPCTKSCLEVAVTYPRNLLENTAWDIRRGVIRVLQDDVSPCTMKQSRLLYNLTSITEACYATQCIPQHTRLVEAERNWFFRTQKYV